MDGKKGENMNRKKTGAVPLQNAKKERFCKLYAARCWGDPGRALLEAGFVFDAGHTPQDFAQELFDDEEIRHRITHLRSLRAAASKADETWIRELLAEIAANAARDSDRIRALRELANVLSGEKMPRRQHAELPGDLVQPLLPEFDGEPDGTRDYRPPDEP